MRGYFDEDEPEPERPRRDTELTLGTGAVLGLIFALLMVCGLCFAAGYAVGHHRSASSASNASTPAPDQEPLQPNGSIPKPSATPQTTPPEPQTGDSPTNPEPGAPAANAESNYARAEPGRQRAGGIVHWIACGKSPRLSATGGARSRRHARRGNAQCACSFAGFRAVAGADCRGGESSGRRGAGRSPAQARLLSHGEA